MYSCKHLRWHKEAAAPSNAVQGSHVGYYDLFGEDSANTYANLKGALLQRLSPDTKEDHLAACELLSRRKLQEGRESIDGVGQPYCHKAFPSLPAEMYVYKIQELHYHPINSYQSKYYFNWSCYQRPILWMQYEKHKNLVWYTADLTPQNLWIWFSTLKRLLLWTRWKQHYRTFQNNYTRSAIFVPKPNGEICICIDFVQLNHCTKKDSCPVLKQIGLVGWQENILQTWQFPMHQ